MENLKILRKERKMNQQDIANILGVGRTTYTQYETGASQPDNDTIIKLANYFNVSIDYLLGRTEVKNPINELPNDFDMAYFRTMQNAKKEGISPHDIDLMIDFIKKAKLRDGE